MRARVTSLTMVLAWTITAAFGCTQHNPIYGLQGGAGQGGAVGAGGSGPGTPHDADPAESPLVVDVAPTEDVSLPDVGDDEPGIKIPALDGGQTDTRDAGADMTGSSGRLLGYWRFDDASGLTATDSSGRGHHGTLENLGGDAAWVPGHTGGGIEFSAGRKGQGVRIPIAADLDEIRAFTIAAWCVPKRTAAANLWSLISRQRGTDAAELFNLTVSDDELIVFLARSDTDEPSQARARDVVATNKWSHVAATYDGKALRLYANGVEVAATTNLPDRLRSDVSPLYLGTNKNHLPDQVTDDESFEGTLDEVAIYSSALTAANIKALAAGASALSF